MQFLCLQWLILKPRFVLAIHHLILCTSDGHFMASAREHVSILSPLSIISYASMYAACAFQLMTVVGIGSQSWCCIHRNAYLSLQYCGVLLGYSQLTVRHKLHTVMFLLALLVWLRGFWNNGWLKCYYNITLQFPHGVHVYCMNTKPKWQPPSFERKTEWNRPRAENVTS